MEHAVDPITMEVIFNYITGVADEMFLTVRRTSYSPNVKQRADCATAVLSVDGDVIAQSLVAPGHLGSMLGVVQHLLARQSKDSFEPGDMFIANDPYSGGGQHLPDVALVAPVFVAGRCVAFVANIAHHADIGGMVPGSEALVCRSIFQEGIRLPPVCLVKAGKVQDDVLNIFLLNSRTPDERRGDVSAQIAANLVGVRRLAELYARYGEPLVAASMQAYLAYTERRFRHAVSSIPDGDYHGEDYLDPDIYDDEQRPIRVFLTLSKRGDRILFDLTGTAGQAQSAINSSLNSTLSTVYVLVKMLVDPGLPGNSGYFKAVEVNVPLGSVLNPRPGAAVGARTLACHVLGDVIAQAFSEAMPERALAGSSTHQQFSFSGVRPDGEMWVNYEAVAGAYGARPYHDGMDAVRIHMSGALNLPVESLEHAYPLLVERYALRTDSAGPGRFRGGLGIVRDYRALAPVSVSLSGQRQAIQPKGLAGGGDGVVAEFVLNPATPGETRLPAAVADQSLRPGDVISIRTPGGAGYGDPRERDRERVAQDLAEGRISREVAVRDYGLVEPER